MEYTRLGVSGLQVSQICLGMMSYRSSSWRDWVLEIAMPEAPYVPHPILGHE